MILSNDNISKMLLNIINSTPIFDLHTHLFPPKHEGYFLLGFKNLLNYHYLIAELLTATNIDASTFYSYNDCLLYTSPSPRDLSTSRMPSSA